jgi:hypothetical protein
MKARKLQNVNEIADFIVIKQVIQMAFTLIINKKFQKEIFNIH